MLCAPMGETLARVPRVGLLHRHGFAGQRGLDDEQVLRGNQPHVAGNHVAGGELHDVAGDELAERDFPGLAVAHDGGGDADHRLEFGRGGVRPRFLHEAQAQSQHHHQQHHRAGAEIAGGKRQDRQHRQQNHQRIAAGGKQPVQPGVFLLGATSFGPN